MVPVGRSITLELDVAVHRYHVMHTLAVSLAWVLLKLVRLFLLHALLLCSLLFTILITSHEEERADQLYVDLLL